MLLDTPVCNFGWQAQDFTLQDAYGKSFTMSEQLGEKGLLILFICNHCPYVKRIARRLAEDIKQLQAEGINALAVMSNDFELVPDDSPQKMQQFAKQFGFTFPYLIDKEQKVGRDYGAVCTPDFFGFNSKGELQYRGRLDNGGMQEAQSRVPELLNAMRMIAETGHGPQSQYPSMGCSIKWRS